MTANEIVKISLKEALEAMLIKKGITEGKWVLVAQFSFAAITAGPNDNEMFPTAMVGLTEIGIQPVIENVTKGVVVDASLLTTSLKAAKKVAASRSKRG